jgi:hypothetical protein
MQTHQVRDLHAIAKQIVIQDELILQPARGIFTEHQVLPAQKRQLLFILPFDRRLHWRAKSLLAAVDPSIEPEEVAAANENLPDPNIRDRSLTMRRSGHSALAFEPVGNIITRQFRAIRKLTLKVLPRNLV